MKNRNRKTITLSMIIYEFRNVIGNPYVHIFGIVMPVVLSVFIIKINTNQIHDAAVIKELSTSIFLGLGTMIPLASILIGYSVRQAEDLSKGIPERLHLFGIKSFSIICNRAISEGIFTAMAFIIYFLAGIFFIELKAPVLSGIIAYIICMVIFSVFCFILAHAIASLAKKFGITYCITMMLYFAFMMLSGMMGVAYDNMPSPLQALARLLPTTYINRDFSKIWVGKSYDFVPMIQAYLFFGAVSGILLFIAIKKTAHFINS